MKKNIIVFFILFILSFFLTIGLAMLFFLLGDPYRSGGIPFEFSPGIFGQTNYDMLWLDVAFWFMVLLVAWKLLLKILKKG